MWIKWNNAGTGLGRDRPEKCPQTAIFMFLNLTIKQLLLGGGGGRGGDGGE